MKLNNIELSFDNFASEMAKLKNEKHFDYLVTIIGEDFGEEGLGCIYILENSSASSSWVTQTCAVFSSAPISRAIHCARTSI